MKFITRYLTGFMEIAPFCFLGSSTTFGGSSPFTRKLTKPQKPTATKEEINKELAKLVKDFPNSPLPVFISLTHSMSSMKPIRQGGELDDAKFQEHKEQGIPSPERKGTRNYTHKQWQHVIALCKKGEKLAPDNGIFDVLESYWQFAEFHDDVGWKALERAIKKPKITQYGTALSETAASAHQIGYGRRLMWEELYLYPSSFYNWAFGNSDLLIDMRKFMHWLVWEGMKQQRKGNHAKALKMYGIAFQMADIRVRSSYGLMGDSTAHSLESIAISGPWGNGVRTDEPIDSKKGVEYSLHLRRAAFKKYAREHGRPDLVKYANIAKVHRKREMSMIEVGTNIRKPYVSGATNSFLLWRAGVLLIWLLAGALIVAVITSLIATRQKISNPTFKEYDFWRGAISFAALPASLVLIAGYTTSLVLLLQHVGHAHIVDLVTLRFLSHGSISPIWMIAMGVLTPIIYGIAYCWNRAAQNNSEQKQSKVLLWKRIRNVIGSVLFVIFWATLASGKLPFPTKWNAFRKLFFRWVFGTSPALTSQWINIVYFSAIIVVIGILIYLTNRILQAKKAGNAKSTFIKCTHLLANSSLRWIALASVLYVITLAISVPVRAPLHKLATQRIKHGEMSLYRKTLKSTFPMKNDGKGDD